MSCQEPRLDEVAAALASGACWGWSRGDARDGVGPLLERTLACVGAVADGPGGTGSGARGLHTTAAQNQPRGLGSVV